MHKGAIDIYGVELKVGNRPKHKMMYNLEPSDKYWNTEKANDILLRMWTSNKLVYFWIIGRVLKQPSISPFSDCISSTTYSRNYCRLPYLHLLLTLRQGIMCHIVGAVVGTGITIEEVIFQSIYYLCECKKAHAFTHPFTELILLETVRKRDTKMNYEWWL